MGDQAQHIRHLLTTTSADVSIKDRDARPPLTYAVLNFSPACIRVSESYSYMTLYTCVPQAILELRESVVNLTDHHERTALHYACAEGSADCVRTLLSFRRYTHTHHTTHLYPHQLHPPTHYAPTHTLHPHKCSCDLHCTDNNGTTPLHWAAAGNQPGLVQLLIR